MSGDWSSDVCSSDLVRLFRQRIAPGRGVLLFILVQALCHATPGRQKTGFAGGGATPYPGCFPSAVLSGGTGSERAKAESGLRKRECHFEE